MTIRVFVGCAANGEDAESCAVLEWSLRERASEPVEIVWMAQSHDIASFWSGWDTSKWATPFSGFRWGIPAFCGYEGRAIYCDSDVIWMGDVAELWHQPFEPGKAVMGKGGGSWRLCVSMWDCAAARSVLPKIDSLRHNPMAHHRMGTEVRTASWVQPFDGNWNVLDGESFEDIRDPAIKVHHYTRMDVQPHLVHAIPRLRAAGERHWFEASGGKLTGEPHPRADLQELFDESLRVAELDGYSVESYIPAKRYGDYRKLSLAGYHRSSR